MNFGTYRIGGGHGTSTHMSKVSCVTRPLYPDIPIEQATVKRPKKVYLAGDKLLAKINTQERNRRKKLERKKLTEDDMLKIRISMSQLMNKF
jgi:hypothetical protein